MDPLDEFFTPKALYEHIKQWRVDTSTHYNEVIAGRPLLDQRVMLDRIGSLEQDVSQLLVYCELLAKRHIESNPSTPLSN